MEIKLDVQTNTTIPVDQWEEGWDVISTLNEAINKNLISDDSIISGNINLPVCSKNDKKMVEDKFDVLINVDENLLQFEDKEVCKVLANDIGSLYSVESFSNLTSLPSFENNQDVVEFNELKFTNVVSCRNMNFNGCINLKKLNVEKITTSDLTFENTAVKYFAFLSLNSFNYMPAYHKEYVGASHAFFFPIITNIGCIRSCAVSVYDVGKKATALTGSVFYLTKGDLRIFICRANIVIEEKNKLSEVLKLFVLPELVSNYDDIKPAFPIGGQQWCEEFGCEWNGTLEYDLLPNNIKYADVYKYVRNDDGTENTEEINRIIDAYENA